MASSSSASSIILESKYDVFLSFTGEDTRHNFTSHLYAALCRKQIQTFIDDEGLKSGAEISPVLLKAIEDSKISVIIFSKDYTSSKWCLDELEKILECKDNNGQIVISVFCNFKSQILFFIYFRLESKLVEEVMEDISKKLNHTSTSSDYKGLDGLFSHMEKIRSLLWVGSLDFQVVGIYGMGGIGKTTLVNVVYNQIWSQFEGHCFSINVREQSEKYRLIHVREQVLSQVLGEYVKISTPSTPHYIQERIQRKKGFIVLNVVNTIEQLEVLAGGINQFGIGSRIIITSRDKQVLKSYGVHNIYEVQGFNNYEALQLFCIYAFKQKHPLKDFARLSEKVLSYAKGNPLALKVLGSFLYGKSNKIGKALYLI